jgi:dihydrofolate synthase/folylpolyglutamate synthase
LRGQHQAQNAGVAVAVLQQVRGRFQKITEETICAGLAGVRWPCRLEQVLDHPPVIVDVAHNPAGAMSLRDEITPGITILAVSSDKDARRIVEALAPVTRLFILTRYASARSLSVEALEAAAADLPHQCAANLDEAIHIGLSLASDDQPLLITGSIFTAGEARQILIKKYAAPPLQF